MRLRRGATCPVAADAVLAACSKDGDADDKVAPPQGPAYTAQDRGDGRCVALGADRLALGINEVRGPFTSAKNATLVHERHDAVDGVRPVVVPFTP